jgi:histidine triad (HIT) family protein
MSNAAHDPNCLFCKIVAGKIPCHRVLETDRALAFLDIGPLSPGHTLVIPKTHAVTLDQLGDEDAAGCAAIIPRVARAVLKATGAADWNLLQNNGTRAHQVVMHVHFHIIPRFEKQGLDIGWAPGKADDAAALLAKVRAGL